VIETATIAAGSRLSEGFMYLLGLGVIVAIFGLAISFFNRNSVKVSS
jgi:hypothetical protein